VNDAPLVSIITPCYNAGKFIEETILSVLAQTYENWEMLIVEDKSTDNSLDIIYQYTLKDNRIKLYINEQNIGPSKSRNRAIKEAKGEYLAFLDNDDVWLPQKLEKQISLMEKDNLLLTYSAYDIIDHDSNKIATFSVQEKVTYYDMLKTSTIGTLTMVYSIKRLGKQYFITIGHEDYTMKLNLLKKMDCAIGINESLAKYRIVNNSLSRNKIRAAQWQWKIYRDVENLSWIKSVFYFAHYTYRGLTKYKNIK